MKKSLLTAVAMVLATASFALAAGNLAPTTLAQGTFSAFTLGISNAGEIVGYGTDASGQAALYWTTPNSTPVILPGGRGYQGAGISASGGKIVGRFGNYWATPTSAPTMVTGSSVADLTGINSTGQIVGHSYGGAAPVSDFWSTPSSNPPQLAPGSAARGCATGLNDAGGSGCRAAP